MWPKRTKLWYGLYYAALAACPVLAAVGRHWSIEALIAASIVLMSACVIVLRSRIVAFTILGVIVGALVLPAHSGPADVDDGAMFIVIAFAIGGTVFGAMADAIQNPPPSDGDAK
jgi:hypothetical protein